MEKQPTLAQDGALKSIHTYQSDTEDAIASGNITRTKIYLAEQKRQQEILAQEREEEEEIENKKGSLLKNTRFLVVTFLFLFIAGVGLRFFLENQSSTPKNLQPKPLSEEQKIISHDGTSLIELQNLDQASLIQTIKGSREQYNSSGIQIYSLEVKEEVGNRKLTPEEFLFALTPNAPGLFLRSIASPFVFGQAPNGAFLILKIYSYENARGGLLEGERTIGNELDVLFNKDQGFMEITDEYVENHDVRVLKDESGGTYFLYSFLNQDMLIFAENEAVFKEIVDRINASKR